MRELRVADLESRLAEAQARAFGKAKVGDLMRSCVSPTKSAARFFGRYPFGGKSKGNSQF